MPQGRLAGRSNAATPKSGVIPTALQAPNANAHIERWIGSARRECLDRPLILSQRQLNRVLRVYVRHDTSSARTAHSTRKRPTQARRPPSQAGAPDQRWRRDDETSSAASSTNTKPRQPESELMHPTPSHSGSTARLMPSFA